MIKIAVIGAGSIAFTRKLMADILAVPELQDTFFHFMDINQTNLDNMFQLAERDVRENEVKTDARIEKTLDRREALTDADYVINLARVGGLEGLQYDIEIPLKYGVDQCIGDTLAPGGIMYAQRGIPVLLDMCSEMREVSKPDVLLLNYANPNPMLTWAATHYGGVRCVGLCHGVEGGQRLIARLFGIPHEEIDVVCAGINHQTWYIEVLNKGKDITHDLLEAFERLPEIIEHEKCRVDVLRRTGYFSTETNGHLSEYLHWYRKTSEDVARWAYIDDRRPLGGETAGYLRFSIKRRNFLEADMPKWLEEDVKPFTQANRSHEHGSFIIESFETGRLYRGHFNLVNNACITNLPSDAIVEAPGYVDATGINMPPVGDLPDICAAICNASISVQRLAVKAAVKGDLMLLKQAMMIDPLTAAACTTPEVWQMVDELIVAEEEWLPQFRDEIPAAKHRIETEEPLGTHDIYPPTRKQMEVQIEDLESTQLDMEDAEVRGDLYGTKS